MHFLDQLVALVEVESGDSHIHVGLLVGEASHERAKLFYLGSLAGENLVGDGLDAFKDECSFWFPFRNFVSDVRRVLFDVLIELFIEFSLEVKDEVVKLLGILVRKWSRRLSHHYFWGCHLWR